MSDYNKTMIEFLATYPDIQNSPIFFNFINAKDNDIQFLTSSNDKALDKRYIDGSILKRYTFSLVITKSITNLAVAKDMDDNIFQGVMSENLDDIADIQAMMDWINEQDEEQNYPDFGENKVVQEMHTTTENPSLDGINTEVTPALALYSMEIRIDYIDYTKVIWS